jgi:RNA polymerase sigma-70 factor (ECF subfamily)
MTTGSHRERPGPPVHGLPPDEHWLRRSVSDPPDFAVLFDRHAADVHRYLARRAGTQHADDLLSEVFLVAFEERARYDPARGEVRAWLFGIATTLLRRHHRDEVRGLRALARIRGDGPDGGPADGVVGRVDAAAQTAAIAAELAALPQRDRDALLLHAWADLGYREIAAALDVPVGTVRSRLHRVRNRLRPLLDRTRPDTDR